ncbi:MAG TPA: lysophospholipid acyltransferase family protein [Bacillota bacterium]|nr:lysophospholipid acyltransferase family protein [Bacillota bacterium]
MLYYLGRLFTIVWVRLFHRFKVTGQNNIPREGGVVLVGNHVSLWDPFVLGSAVSRKVYFMAKEELFRFKPLGALLKAWGAFPVQRGGGDRKALETGLRHLKSGEVLGIFVEGGRNRARQADGMLPPQPGAAMLARKTNTPIIPMALVGTEHIGRHPFQKVSVAIGTPIEVPTDGLSPKEAYDVIGHEIARAIGELRATIVAQKA